MPSKSGSTPEPKRQPYVPIPYGPRVIEAVWHTAQAVAKAELANQDADQIHKIYLPSKTHRMLELSLGLECPKRPLAIDQFSFLTGAVHMLSQSLLAGNPNDFARPLPPDQQGL